MLGQRDRDRIFSAAGIQGVMEGDGNYREFFKLTPPEQSKFTPDGTVTDAGYQRIGSLIENTIDTMGLTVKSGYLSNQTNTAGNMANNVNSFGESQVVRFTPVGAIRTGMRGRSATRTPKGASGIWSSTNPAVMSVDQHGNGTALSGGQARIWFMMFDGNIFSPFDVSVGSICPGTIYCPVGCTDALA